MVEYVCIFLFGLFDRKNNLHGQTFVVYVAQSLSGSLGLAHTSYSFSILCYPSILT